MSWSAPSKSLALNELINLLKCKMHAYLAYGTGATGDIPTTLAGINALLTGVTQKFVPLGDLHKDPITWKWERTTIELHKGTMREGLKLSAEIKSAALGASALTLLKNTALNDAVSILLIPFNMPATASVGAPVKVVVLNGMMLLDKGEGNGNNTFGMVTFALTAEPNNIGEVINYVTVTS